MHVPLSFMDMPYMHNIICIIIAIVSIPMDQSRSTLIRTGPQDVSIEKGRKKKIKNTKTKIRTPGSWRLSSVTQRRPLDAVRLKSSGGGDGCDTIRIQLPMARLARGVLPPPPSLPVRSLIRLQMSSAIENLITFNRTHGT